MYTWGPDRKMKMSYFQVDLFTEAGLTEVQDLNLEPGRLLPILDSKGTGAGRVCHWNDHAVWGRLWHCETTWS